MRYVCHLLSFFLLSVPLVACKSTTNLEHTEERMSSENEPPRSMAEVARINANLGLAYLEQKNVQRAKQKLLLALNQGPNIPEPWYSMAYFHEATGNIDEASKYYSKAVEIAPDRGDAQNNYGTFLCRNGHYQDSITHFMIAAKAPTYLDPAAAYENAGLCSMKAKEYKHAANYFTQALLKDPARKISMLNLAAADIKLGRYQDAKSMLFQYSMVTPPDEESRKLVETLKQHIG